MRIVATLALLWLAPLASAQTQAPTKAASAASVTSTPTTATVQAAPASQATAPPTQDATAKPASKPASNVDPAKGALIRKLFEVQGTRKSMQEIIAGMLTNMKPNLAASLPPGEYQGRLIDLFFEKFQQDLKID